MRPKNPMAKKPQQILFSKNTYSPKTKVENWDFAIRAEKKDNYVYRDHLSNHLSTYLRLGNDDHGVKLTETEDMLQQIFTKRNPVYIHKPLVNFTSYPCTDTPGRNKLMTSAGLAQLPSEFGVMDYLTTQQDDYRNPNPSREKPSDLFGTAPLKDGDTTQSILGSVLRLSPNKMVYLKHKMVYLCPVMTLSSLPFKPEHSSAYTLLFSGRMSVNAVVLPKLDLQVLPLRCCYEQLTLASPPWLMNRIIRSDLTQNYGTAPPKGDYQCLDTHTPIDHIRKMREVRYKSFDPSTGLQDFPAFKN